MVVLDSTDIKILKIFNDLKEDEFTGTRLIAKYLFPNESKAGLRAKERMINYRIRRMSPDLIKIEKREKYEYVFRKENVLFKKHKFPNGIRNAVLIFSDGAWSIFEI